MDSMFRWPLTQLVYAAICFVIGGVILAAGAANDVDVLMSLGGLVMVIGVFYVLAGLWNLSRALMDDSER